MITRGYFIGQIIDELTAVSQQVKSRAGLQLFDLNRYLEDFFKDIDLMVEEDLTPENLLDILRRYSSNISVFEASTAINNFLKRTDHVQKSYMGVLKDIYVKNFILRINEVKENKIIRKEDIGQDEFLEAIQLL